DSSLRHLLLRHDGHDESMALDRFGFGSLAADHLLDLDAWRSVDPTTALVALADHWSTERDAALAGELAPAVAGLVEAALRPARRASSHPQHLVDRLALVAELLQAAGEPRAAEDVMRVEPALVTTVDRARAGVATAAPAVSDAAVLD